MGPNYRSDAMDSWHRGLKRTGHESILSVKFDGQQVRKIPVEKLPQILNLQTRHSHPWRLWMLCWMWGIAQWANVPALQMFALFIPSLTVPMFKEVEHSQTFSHATEHIYRGYLGAMSQVELCHAGEVYAGLQGG